MMMTSLEWFAICLPIGGVVAAGLYAYVLNRNASRLNAAVPPTPTGAEVKAPRRRYNVHSELKLETAVKRANQAASFAEAAAAKAEQATRRTILHPARETVAGVRTSFGHPGGGSGGGTWYFMDAMGSGQGGRSQLLEVVSARGIGPSDQAVSRPQ